MFTKISSLVKFESKCFLKSYKKSDNRETQGSIQKKNGVTFFSLFASCIFDGKFSNVN